MTHRTPEDKFVDAVMAIIPLLIGIWYGSRASFYGWIDALGIALVWLVVDVLVYGWRKSREGR